MMPNSTQPSAGCFASFAAGASRFASRLSAGARACGTALADRLARLCSSSVRVANSSAASPAAVGASSAGASPPVAWGGAVRALRGLSPSCSPTGELTFAPRRKSVDAEPLESKNNTVNVYSNKTNLVEVAKKQEIRDTILGACRDRFGTLLTSIVTQALPAVKALGKNRTERQLEEALIRPIGDALAALPQGGLQGVVPQQTRAYIQGLDTPNNRLLMELPWGQDPTRFALFSLTLRPLAHELATRARSSGDSLAPELYLKAAEVIQRLASSQSFIFDGDRSHLFPEDEAQSSSARSSPRSEWQDAANFFQLRLRASVDEIARRSRQDHK